MKAVEVKGLRKQYGELIAVNSIDFHVEKGEIFGLLGPNGAGKTTTLESISGVRKYDEGQVLILDEHLETINDLYHMIGVQLQETIYQDHIRVQEICELFASFYNEPMDYMALLERFDLQSKLKSNVSKLSGGQRQKLSITLALIGNPEIVFLDELTTGLDPEARLEMWDYIRELKAEGRTIVMSTHYMEEAAALCDRIGVIKDGDLIVCDTVEEVVNFANLPFEITFEITSDWKLPNLVNALGKEEAEIDGNKIKVETHDDQIISNIIVHFHEHKIKFKSFDINRPTLEDAYLQLIGGQDA
jgi:ABC-2 type transport system ATP-binding protein